MLSFILWLIAMFYVFKIFIVPVLIVLGLMERKSIPYTSIKLYDYKVHFTDGGYEYVYKANSKNHARKIALYKRNGRILYVEKA